MERSIMRALAEMAEQPEAQARSVAYMSANMARFLKKNERVLLCGARQENAFCHIMEQAIRNCEAVPIWLGTDLRWLTILKTAFTSKCNCIVGQPLLLLGLSKIARHMGTPLFARNVLLMGYSCPQWIVEAVETGLDCRAWGCYDPGIGAVIAGFSCRKSSGVHIRDEEYGLDIVDEQGTVLPHGETGDVILYARQDPSLRLFTGNKGYLETRECACGCGSPRLMGLDMYKGEYASLSEVGESLHYWSSILDCRLERSECGLELEAVVFQGEKLPKFPSCAKMVIRPWQPETDMPFDHGSVLKNRVLKKISH